MNELRLCLEHHTPPRRRASLARPGAGSAGASTATTAAIPKSSPLSLVAGATAGAGAGAALAHELRSYVGLSLSLCLCCLMLSIRDGLVSDDTPPLLLHGRRSMVVGGLAHRAPVRAEGHVLVARSGGMSPLGARSADSEPTTRAAAAAAAPCPVPKSCASYCRRRCCRRCHSHRGVHGGGMTAS